MRPTPSFNSNCIKTKAHPVSRGVREAAADWVARRDAGLSAQEELNYAAWLDADPAHRSAVDGLGFAWRTLDHPLAKGAADAVLCQLTRFARQRQRRRTIALGMVSFIFLLAAGLGWKALKSPDEIRSPAGISAVVLLPSIQSLPDGSVAELRDGAQITVEFTDSKRRVVLRRGEAYFKVVKNPARPFVVVAGEVEVCAVGTAFSVDYRKNAVDVLVTEGKVAVALAPHLSIQANANPSQAEPLLVGAGHGTTIDSSARQAESGSRPLSDADLQSRLAWRSPRLEFTGTPLIEAVALLNRHNRIQFIIEDSELARTRVSGIFGAVNTDAFVRLLESSFDVQSERRGADEIVLRRKP